MTTNRQLRDWLKGFPDDAIINIVTTEEYYGGFYRDVSVYTDPLELPDIEMKDLKGWEDHGHVDFDVKYDYDKGGCYGINSITLGKNYRG